MDYRECLEKCIAQMLATASDSMEEMIQLLAAHPVPTAKEWLMVVKKVEREREKADSFDYMGCYELELAKRGHRTYLGEVAREYKQSALGAGVPEDRIADCVAMFFVMNPWAARR